MTPADFTALLAPWQSVIAAFFALGLAASLIGAAYDLMAGRF